MKRLLLVSLMVGLLVCPAMAEKVKTFTEFGTAVSVRLGAGEALWNQDWGYGQWDWYVGDTSSDVSFTNDHLIGTLETKDADNYRYDGLILRFDFKGTLHLMAKDDDNPGKVAGEITGDVNGTFIVDLDANSPNTIVDEVAGTITIVFGAALVKPGDEPVNVAVTNIQTSGKFKSIQAEGPWNLSVNGVVKILRVPNLTLQDNIFAGLGDPALLIGAEEEMVLTGSYYRSSKKK